MKQSLSEIKHDFERWLEDGAVKDSVRRREVLNVCEQILPYFVREKIDDQFDTLYELTDPEDVHKLWKKIKTNSTLKSINSQVHPVTYTDVLHLYEIYLHRPKVKGTKQSLLKMMKNQLRNYYQKANGPNSI